MSTDLAQELAALADESTNYADARAAIGAAQRYRRRRAIAVPVAAGLAALLAVGVIGVRTLVSSGHGPLPADNTTTELVLPPAVTPPAGYVPPLPTDRAVGPAVLAFRVCPQTCPAYLVTAAGAVYTIDVPDGDLDPLPGKVLQIQDLAVYLSPDGRYLAITNGDATTIRDLAGTGIRQEHFGEIMAWSANDRYLLVTGSGTKGALVYPRPNASVVPNGFRIDMKTGIETPVWYFDSTVTNDGHVISVAMSLDPTAVDFQRDLPNDDGETVVYAHSVLKPNEAVSLAQVYSDPEGGGGETDWLEATYGPDNQVAVTAFDTKAEDSRGDNVRTAVVLSNIVTGQITRRVPLPPGASWPFYFGDHVAYAVQAHQSDPIDLYEITDAGETVRISRLPATAEYFVPGMPCTFVGPAYVGVPGYTG